jgi:hypothetical protein
MYTSLYRVYGVLVEAKVELPVMINTASPKLTAQALSRLAH